MRLGWMLALAACSAFAQTSGQALFDTHCALCHGIGATGGRGPGLNRPKLGHAPDDAALKKVIQEGIEPEMPSSWFLSERDVSMVIEYVRSLGKVTQEVVAGDAARGAAGYARNRCGNCHIVAGEGTGFGPELTEIGTRRSAAYLRESIVKPAAALPEGFLMVEAEIRGGETIRGIRLNEDTFTIQIRDAAGRFHSLRKPDLKELRRLRGQSPMPAYGSMAGGELDDLVAYLASRGVK